MKKISMLALAVAACGVAFGANAADSAKTHPDQATPYINVGLTEPSSGAHGSPGGEPGIDVSTVGGGKLISIGGLTKMPGVNTDGNGVTSVKMPGAPGSHSGMGVFNFAKVANAEVYFGEWSHTGKVDDKTHTAYYSGKDASTSVPTGGTASYQVAGINQYSGSNKLNGTLDADFGAKTLKGSIANASLTVGIDAKIQNNASFNGDATANGLAGKTNGQFFGKNQESLAGVAQFADHSKDIAFGGNKK